MNNDIRDELRRVDSGDRPNRAGRRISGATVLRVLCHLAAEIPLVVWCLVEMARGWRPLSDNAVIAFRSYQVLSAHSPMVGQATRALETTPVYGLGPLEYWILAVPVHLDAGQGALWGATLAAVIGIALAVEAGRAAAGAAGALVVTGMVLVLLITWPAIGLDPVWNQWIGIAWFIPTLAGGWAVATGRLRWWPATVLSASIAAQCQEVFALSAVAVCVLSVILGVAIRHRRPTRQDLGWRWLLAGVAVGVAVWIGPLLEELSGRPGNWSLLWRGAHRDLPRVGTGQALGGLASVTEPLPRWLDAPPHHGPLQTFLFTSATLAGHRWWAVTVLAALGVIGGVAWVTRRYRLCAAAWLSLVGAVAAVFSLAAVPLADVLTLGYLQVLLWPIGMMAWATLLWALVELVGGALRRAGARSPLLPRSRSVARRVAAGVGGALVVTLGAITLGLGIPLTSTDLATLGAWSTVPTTIAATSAVAAEAPDVPFALHLRGATGIYRLSVLSAVGYQLVTRGFAPRFSALEARTLGEDWAARGGMPTVTVHLKGPDVVTVTVSSGRRSAADR